jgi:hypothetical protein
MVRKARTAAAMTPLAASIGAVLTSGRTALRPVALPTRNRCHGKTRQARATISAATTVTLEGPTIPTRDKSSDSPPAFTASWMPGRPTP